MSTRATLALCLSAAALLTFAASAEAGALGSKTKYVWLKHGFSPGQTHAVKPGEAVSLNPQPLPPGGAVMINPQPLPPRIQ